MSTVSRSEPRPTALLPRAATGATPESAVAAAVRDALAGEAAAPALMVRAQRRARVERRRRWSTAVVAAVLTAVVATAGVRYGLRADSLDASSVLTVADVEPFVPGAEALDPARRVDPPTDGRGRLLGGWCGSTPLDGVPVPADVRSGYWTQPLLRSSAGGPSTVVSQVSEQVLRFDDEAGAHAYAAAMAASRSTCSTRDLQGSPLPDGYTVLPLTFLGRPHLTLAVAPASWARSAWYIRVVDVRGSVAVDVFTLVAAPMGPDAGRRTLELLDVALDRVLA